MSLTGEESTHEDECGHRSFAGSVLFHVLAWHHRILVKIFDLQIGSLDELTKAQEKTFSCLYGKHRLVQIDDSSHTKEYRVFSHGAASLLDPVST